MRHYDDRRIQNQYRSSHHVARNGHTLAEIRARFRRNPASLTVAERDVLIRRNMARATDFER